MTTDYITRPRPTLDGLMTKLLAEMSFVYFMGDGQGRIYIGHTGGDPRKRPRDHPGFDQLLCLVSAEKKLEKNLHEIYAPYRVSTNSKSIYKAKPILPYIERLLEYRLGTNTIEEAGVLGAPPLPTLLPNYQFKKRGFFLAEADLIAHRDAWQTPKHVIDVVREACGGTIGLDPCTCLEAHQRIRSTYWYTEHMNALESTHDWLADSVYMNPPYRSEHDQLAVRFVQKMRDEYNAGHFRIGIACLNQHSMPAKWFARDVAPYASAFAIWRTRINFHRPLTGVDGQTNKRDSSQNGTVFVCYGDPEPFYNAFATHAYLGTLPQ